MVRPLLWTIWIAGRFTNATGREIASIASRSPSAMTHIWRDLQERLNIDMTLNRQVEALAQILGMAPPKIS
jgi:hypothetical protein